MSAGGSEAGPSLLFVYGTLMSRAGGTLGRSQRERLQREGRSLGAATAHARLYDLGRYPGLVAAAAAGDTVHGEVIALADAAASLAWLDAYEGIVPGQHTHGPYERRRIIVRLAGAGEVEAWTYVWLQSIAGKRLIGDGRWRTPGT